MILIAIHENHYVPRGPGYASYFLSFLLSTRESYLALEPPIQRTMLLLSIQEYEDSSKRG
jgi:hypothetical protein